MNNFNLSLAIRSKGLIDVNLLRVIGFSTKRGDETQFGHFGSGVKYSLALLIRNNIPFKIYNGLEEIVIGIKEHELYSKGESFRTNTITINGIDTSISTEIGPDWEKWMILRELISNAKDQDPGQEIVEVTMSPQILEDYVTWVIDVSKHSYLLNDLKNVYKAQPDITTRGNYNALYFKEDVNDDTIVYSKGFNAGSTKSKALFHIGGDHIEIDERRIHKNFFEWRYAEQILQLTDKSLIRQVIHRLGDAETLEYDCFSYITSVLPSSISEEFQDCLKEFAIMPVTLKNLENFFEDSSKQDIIYVKQNTYLALKPYLDTSLVNGDKGLYKELLITPSDKAFWNLVDQAVSIIAIDYPAIHSYEIKVAKFADANVYGTIDIKNYAIIISEKLVIEPDKKTLLFILSVILEEFYHIEYSFTDCTRKFQNFLFQVLSSYMLQSHSKTTTNS